MGDTVLSDYTSIMAVIFLTICLLFSAMAEVAECSKGHWYHHERYSQTILEDRQRSGIRCDTAAECPEYRPFCFGGTCSECMEDEDCPPYSNTTGGICVFFDHCCLPGYC